MPPSFRPKIAHRIEMGRCNTLVVTRLIEHGAVLRNHNGDEEVLLPQAYVTEAIQRVLAVVDVFIHTDSEDRPVATTQMPTAQRGELGWMEVVDVLPYGAFVDWGLPKNLLIPLSQQKRRLRIGDRIIVRVALDDKTGRLYGTQRIGRGLKPAHGMVPSQKLQAIVIAQTPMGYKVIVDHQYEGMLYDNEIFEPIEIGTVKTVYLKQIRKDGKMDCSLQPIGRQARGRTAEQAILAQLRHRGGVMDVTAKSTPEVIRRQFGLSKKQFKAAVTALVQSHKIIATGGEIRLA